MAAERDRAGQQVQCSRVLPVALGVLALIEMRAGKLRMAAAAAAGGQARTRARPAGAASTVSAGWHGSRRCSVVTRNAAGTAPASELLRQEPGTKRSPSASPSACSTSLGRPQEAIEELEQTVRFRGVRMRGDVAPRPVLADLIEAYVRAGRLEDARRQLADMCEQAERCARPRALAAAARCRGLVEGRGAALRPATLAWHEQRPNELERGRTLLCHGEALRRRKRRTDARAELRAALSAFEGGRCHDLGERARTELRATGGARSPALARHRDTLTPRSLGRPPRHGGAHEPGDRRQALSQPQDDRDPPPPRIPKARRALPNGACSLVRGRQAR